MAEENKLTGVSSPDTSMYPRFQPMPQANPLAQISQLQQLDLQNQSLQQGQATLGLQRVNAVNNMLGTLITKPDLSINDVTNQLDTMVRNKIIAPNEPAAIMQHLQPLANDSEKLRGALKNSYIQSLDHASKMQIGFGNTVPIESPAGTQLFRSDPMRPGILYNQAQGGRPTNFVPAGTSPGQRTEVRPYPNAQGGTDYMSGEQAARKAGTDPVMGTPLQGAFGPSGQPQQQQPGFAGRPLTLEQDAAEISRDRSEAAGTIKGVQAYMNAIPILESMKNTETGPGTAWQAKAKAFLIAQGWKGADQATDQRLELDKYLQQAVAGTPLANRSDFGANITKAASPSSDVQTRTAALELSKQIVAQARASAAAPAAFDDTQGPGGYLKHKSTFSQSQDMNAYKLDMMPEADRVSLVRRNAQFLQSGTPQQRIAAKRFFDSLQAADKAKTLNLGPGQ